MQQRFEGRVQAHFVKSSQQIKLAANRKMKQKEQQKQIRIKFEDSDVQNMGGRGCIGATNPVVTGSLFQPPPKSIIGACDKGLVGGG